MRGVWAEEEVVGGATKYASCSTELEDLVVKGAGW